MEQLTQYNTLISSIEEKIRSISRRKNERKKEKSIKKNTVIYQSGKQSNLHFSNPRNISWTSNFKNFQNSGELKSSLQTADMLRSSSLTWGNSSMKKDNLKFQNVNFFDEKKFMKEIFEKISPLIMKNVKNFVKNLSEKLVKDMNRKFDRLVDEVFDNMQQTKKVYRELELKFGNELKKLNSKIFETQKNIMKEMKIDGKVKEENSVLKGNEKILKVLEKGDWKKNQNVVMENSLLNRSLNEFKTEICSSIHDLEARIFKGKKKSKSKCKKKKKVRRQRTTGGRKRRASLGGVKNNKLLNLRY